MIALTNLKDEKFIVNADQILEITHFGDVMIVCNNGTRYRVKETPDVIIEKILRWQQQKWIPMVHKKEDSN